jgi:hypothetical protein
MVIVSVSVSVSQSIPQIEDVLYCATNKQSAATKRQTKDALTMPYRPGEKTMQKKQQWRALSRSLPKSKKWLKATSDARTLYINILLTSDSYGIYEGEVIALWVLQTRHMGWTEKQTRNALINLVEVGLVDTHFIDECEYINIIDFDKHQTANFLRKRTKTPLVEIPEKQTIGCPNDAQATALRNKNLEVRGKNKIMFTNVNNVGNELPTNERSKPSKNNEWQKKQVEEVFEYWKKREAETGGMGSTGKPPKLSPGRSAKILARLNDKYTVEDLKQCIEGFLKDDHHLGNNDRNTRYTDLTTIFRSPEKVDAGIQKHNQPNKTGDTNANHDYNQYDNPQIIIIDGVSYENPNYRDYASERAAAESNENTNSDE